MSIGSRVPHSGIRVMMELARRHPDAINLSVGEPDFPTPAWIVEAAAREAAAGATRYTPSAGVPVLRELIAARSSARWGRPVEVENVLVTTGAVGAIAGALFASVEPGDEVLIPDPGWPNYRNAATLVQAHAVPYPLRADAGFLPDPDDIEARITERTSAVIINSPSNPTGAVWPRALVDAVVAVATRHGVRVISDEVYEDFAFDGPVASAAEHHPQVIYLSAVSKSYAMTGWRIGFAVAPAEVADVMIRVQEPLVSCPPAVSQAAAVAALSGPQAVVAEMTAAYRRRRDIVVSALEPEGLLPVRPQGAFYALADLRATGLTGFPLGEALLTEAGVVTVPGDGFGAESEGMVRISFAAADDLVLRGCRAIVDFARRHGAGSMGGTR